jgi:anthranilate synthase component I
LFAKITPQSYEELAAMGGRVVVHEEFPADMLTPISAMKILSDDAILLESGEEGRYSCLGFNPYAELKTFGKETTLTIDGTITISADHPLTLFRKLLASERGRTSATLPGFIGGCAGYLGYDAIRYFERVPDRHKDERTEPEIFFQFFQTTICFDHKKNTVILAVVQPATDPLTKGENAIAALRKKLLSTPIFQTPTQESHEKTSIVPDISDDAFASIVEIAQEYIRQGDAFQIVPSRRFQGKTSANPLDVYRCLRMINPSPYMFFFQTPSFAIAGASPELLVSKTDDTVATMPIAGTAARGDTPKDDAANAAALMADPKEDAEHMMLVDLGRNDLGRVSERGTVNVTRLKFIQNFSHVMHLVSLVDGKIDPQYDALDVLTAAFPAGTLTGAPKIRAMEIIDELERSPRGLYGGAVCSINSTGDLMSCIAIRMMVLKDGIATVRAGAGVVHDSVPLKEAEETRQKAQAVIDAISMAERGGI